MKNAFTLVEVMIVVAIVGILAAIAVPSFIKAKKEAEKKKQELAVNIPQAELQALQVVPPRIPVKQSLEIIAMGSTTAFTVYKIADVSEIPTKKFYVVVGTDSNIPPHSISLEKAE